ncbi:MAG TPA: SPOR domain-containing protein [Burkholderiales bacterium]|nr:SPOR domain-containing protein [Burkholderiales bacterium]
MKDYKPRPREKKRKPVGGTLLGIFIGLVLGLAIATAAAIYVTNAPVPFVNKTQQQRATTPQADQKLAEAAKAGAAEKPKFDFYKILPGQEEPVTDRELKSAAAKQAEKSGAPRDLYFVQAGAFQNPADADNLKARLALMGLQASVEPANLPDKGTWYRVRLGPYTQLDEINRVRQTLAQNAIDASLVKIKN